MEKGQETVAGSGDKATKQSVKQAPEAGGRQEEWDSDKDGFLKYEG